MDENLSKQKNDKKPCRCTFRIPDDLFDKLCIIAEYEGKTKADKLREIIRERIEAFEKEHGEIPYDSE